METRYADLIKKLTKLTIDGNVEWEKSSTEWQYRLELKSATFVIDKMQTQIVEGILYNTSYELIMYNNRNIEISIAKETIATNSNENSILYELYCAAENSYLKETETIKKVMDELNELDLPI
ncbi:hypothetical protein [Alistipes muris]|uniref:hypothetical protein n=1 Tax=Alistipes muris TaxID=2941326 RepID=UPI0020412095|nr:hypothetical protein [Alistipes muris]